MGTNFYLQFEEDKTCPTCGHTKKVDRFHIGKSSGGWCFSLHVYPDGLVSEEYEDYSVIKINDLEDWKKLFYANTIIYDEYGEKLGPEEMVSSITDRKWLRPAWDINARNKALNDMRKYKSEAHFHQVNNSDRGPHNLLRHRVDNKYCIGHGEGTWDLMIGEFS